LNSPINLSAEQVVGFLPMRSLVDALREAFAASWNTPPRSQFPIESKPGSEGILLLMPSWSSSGAQPYIGVKLVNVFPNNTKLGKSALTSVYTLFDGATGEYVATLEGNTLTNRRTVALAALAADLLARPDARDLLILGSGRIARLLPHAYQAVRDIREVTVWNVNSDSAEQLVTTLLEEGFNARLAGSLDEALGRADIISAATLSQTPLVKGDLLKPGTHVDLIGAFTPEMRESDNHLIATAKVYIDTIEAMHEAGDIMQPIRSGCFTPDEVVGTLAQLCQGAIPKRVSSTEITVFKSVGTSLADLAAAKLAYEHAT
jgi:ornithine cyclodeaminase/alanine dehydrogenase-like protein (mu-crystallin family)